MKRKGDNTNEQRATQSSFIAAEPSASRRGKGPSSSMESAQKSIPMKQSASSCAEALCFLEYLFEKKKSEG